LPIVLKFKFTFLFLMVSVSALRSQDTTKSKPVFHFRNTVLFCANYGRQTPVGLLADRFGGNNSVGLIVAYKFGRNFQVQAGINTIFGSRVKENGMFDSLIGSSGYLMDVNGAYSQVRQYERGYNWHVDLGKVFSLGRFERNSGLLVTAGLGFMQHKIKFSFQRTTLPQLENGYYKGYDRLTNGLMARAFVGYQRIDPDAMLNFMIGVELMNGFTKNRREFNYDTRMKDNTSRNDLLIGLKAGIMVSIAGRQAGTKKGQEEKFFE
jgi:hypothetical protein